MSAGRKRAAAKEHPPPGRLELGDGAWLRFEPAWWCDPEDALARLLAELCLQSSSIRLFGREVLQPRLMAWLGPAHALYRYSGTDFQPSPFGPALEAVAQQLRAHCGTPLDTCLANFYRGGADSMGWHSDDEPCFGEEPLIASLSFGAARRFLLREKRSAPGQGPRTLEFSLGDGDLLVMGGSTQEHWKHALPKSSRTLEPRLNLTFRSWGEPRRL